MYKMRIVGGMIIIGLAIISLFLTPFIILNIMTAIILVIGGVIFLISGYSRVKESTQPIQPTIRCRYCGSYYKENRGQCPKCGAK